MGRPADLDRNVDDDVSFPYTGVRGNESALRHFAGEQWQLAAHRRLPGAELVAAGQADARGQHAAPLLRHPEPVREHAAPPPLRRKPLRREQQRQDAHRHRQGARTPPLRGNGKACYLKHCTYTDH